MKYLYIFITCILVASCQAQPAKTSKPQTTQVNIAQNDTTSKTIHVFVALCDNKYQGIVPVPAGIGNGQNANTNLYWGAAYGVRTYFKKSKEWKLVRTDKAKGVILERLVFKHVSNDYYLVADAYDGQYIQNCTVDFLNSCAGQMKDTLQVGNTTIGIGGHGKLLAYIGHDGLMDFQLSQSFANADGNKRSSIILACISKSYFAPHLKQTNAAPLIWTTGLMCPEAYTLHDALTAYMNNEPTENVRAKAAQAYARYQKCSEKAARGLLVTGY